MKTVKCLGYIISLDKTEKCYKCVGQSIMGGCMLEDKKIPKCKDGTCNIFIINNQKRYQKWVSDSK